MGFISGILRGKITFLFSFGTFIIWILASVIAIIGISFGNLLDAKVLINSGCYDSENIGRIYNDAIGKMMCTDSCPCYSGPNDENIKLWQNTKIDFEKFGRSFNYENVNLVQFKWD